MGVSVAHQKSISIIESLLELMLKLQLIAYLLRLTFFGALTRVNVSEVALVGGTGIRWNVTAGI